jgi:hypothetical protein
LPGVAAAVGTAVADWASAGGWPMGVANAIPHTARIKMAAKILIVKVYNRIIVGF